MLLLTEKQMDRAWLFAPLTAVAPMLIYLQIRLLPPGWGFGVFTLYSLFTLGVCGLSFNDWRTESGKWIVAVLLLCSLIPTYLAVAYWRYVMEIKPLLQAQRPAIWSWRDLLLALDFAIGIGLLQYQVRLGLTVVIENLRRTRHIPFRVW